jgi:transposase
VRHGRCSGGRSGRGPQRDALGHHLTPWPKLSAECRVRTRTRGYGLADGSGLSPQPDPQDANRLRWHLHELDPELDVPARRLNRLNLLDRLITWLAEQSRPDRLGQVLARLAAELLTDIRAATARINALEREINTLARQAAPRLMALPGAGGLTTAKIVGETANITRFRSEACFAMHAGVAPIPASSGRTQRHRLARGGNRQLNAALHRIAITQVRITASPGQLYYQRRRAQGDTAMEALRALKRRLAQSCSTFSKPTQPSP